MTGTVNSSPGPAAKIDVDDDLTTSAPWTEVMRLSSNQNVTVRPPKLEEEIILCPSNHQVSLAPRPGILVETLTEQETGFKVLSKNGGVIRPVIPETGERGTNIISESGVAETTCQEECHGGQTPRSGCLDVDPPDIRSITTPMTDILPVETKNGVAEGMCQEECHGGQTPRSGCLDVDPPDIRSITTPMTDILPVKTKNGVAEGMCQEECHGGQTPRSGCLDVDPPDIRSITTPMTDILPVETKNGVAEGMCQEECHGGQTPRSGCLDVDPPDIRSITTPMTDILPVETQLGYSPE